jgi:hypothetical protein
MHLTGSGRGSPKLRAAIDRPGAATLPRGCDWRERGSFSSHAHPKTFCSRGSHQRLTNRSASAPASAWEPISRPARPARSTSCRSRAATCTRYSGGIRDRTFVRRRRRGSPWVRRSPLAAAGDRVAPALCAPTAARRGLLSFFPGTASPPPVRADRCSTRWSARGASRNRLSPSPCL